MIGIAQRKRGADFALRVAFYAAAPFLVVFAAELFPVPFALPHGRAPAQASTGRPR